MLFGGQFGNAPRQLNSFQRLPPEMMFPAL